MKVRYVSIIVLGGVLAVMSGMPLLSSGSIANYAYARYANTNTQTQANTNECNTGTNCAITSPQTQGDGTANSPTNLQISKFNEDGGVGEDELGEGTATLLLHLVLRCPQGFVCPSLEEFQYEVIPHPVNPEVQVAVFPDSFSGDEFQEVNFVANPPVVVIPYTMRQIIPPTPSGLSLIQTLHGDGEEATVCRLEEGTDVIRGIVAGSSNVCIIFYDYFTGG